VWVVRILVRLLLSNIHLLTDARERVTMVQTYLALLRRGKIKDDERMFILQTLFRPETWLFAFPIHILSFQICHFRFTFVEYMEAQ
jgi:hypothetical protein